MIEVKRKYNNLSRTTEYYIKGTYILHREDGPAMLSSCGTMTWCLGDIFFNTKEKWFEALPENKKVAVLYSKYIVGG